MVKLFVGALRSPPIQLLLTNPVWAVPIIIVMFVQWPLTLHAISGLAGGAGFQAALGSLMIAAITVETLSLPAIVLAINERKPDRLASLVVIFVLAFSAVKGADLVAIGRILNEGAARAEASLAPQQARARLETQIRELDGLAVGGLNSVEAYEVLIERAEADADREWRGRAEAQREARRLGELRAAALRKQQLQEQLDAPATSVSGAVVERDPSQDWAIYEAVASAVFQRQITSAEAQNIFTINLVLLCGALTTFGIHAGISGHSRVVAVPKHEAVPEDISENDTASANVTRLPRVRRAPTRAASAARDEEFGWGDR